MKFRGFVALTVFSGVGGYLAYQNLLSDEQREAVDERVRQVRAMASRIGSQVKPMLEDLFASHTQNADHHNQEQTRRQWESLGF